MMSAADRVIQVVHHGSHHGQHDFSLVMTNREEAVGRIDYSEFDKVPQIQYIWVEPACRRQGIATELLHRLQRDYPTTEINWGSLTPDGVAFQRSLSFVEVPNRLAIAAREQLEQVRGRRDAILQSDAADYSSLNDLHDRIEVLEGGLTRERAVIRLVDIRSSAKNTHSTPRATTMNPEVDRLGSTPQRAMLTGQDLEILQRSIVVIREFGARATPEEQSAIQRVGAQLESLHVRAKAQMQAMRFRATWDESFVSPETKVLGAEDLDEERGYTQKEVEQIRALGVGQTWVSRDYGAAHTVTRLPDLRPDYVPRLVQKSWSLGMTQVPSFIGELYRRAESLGDPDPSIEWLANEAQCLQRQIAASKSRYSGEEATKLSEEIDGFLKSLAKPSDLLEQETTEAHLEREVKVSRPIM